MSSTGRIDENVSLEPSQKSTHEGQAQHFGHSQPVYYLREHWCNDGEREIGPVIVLLPPRKAAKMKFRLKPKYWAVKGVTCANYDPELPVLPGSQAWEMRVAVNKLYKAGRMAEYERAKKDLVDFLDGDSEEGRKNVPVSLSLRRKTGDKGVMHGHKIGQLNELYFFLPPFIQHQVHSVLPKAKL